MLDLKSAPSPEDSTSSHVPLFGARKMARRLLLEVADLKEQLSKTRAQLDTLGALTIVELDARRRELEHEIVDQTSRLEREHAEHKARLEREGAAAAASLRDLQAQQSAARQLIVETEDLALLQESGVYAYRHPLTDAVAYASALATLNDQIRR